MTGSLWLPVSVRRDTEIASNQRRRLKAGVLGGDHGPFVSKITSSFA